MMSWRRSQRPAIILPLAVLTLILFSGAAVARQLGPVAAQPSYSSGPAFRPIAMEPKSLGAETAERPLVQDQPAMASRGGRESSNTATLLPSATNDPHWISEPARPASYQGSAANSTLLPDGFRVGSISVVPYGRLWADMIHSSSRATPGDFILWIDSPDDQGEETFVIDARRSRVGMDLQGPEVDVFGGMNGGGKVEIDFYGTFPNRNQTNLRLRHVYWEAKNENLRMLAGQTWDVTSPLLPNTVNFAVGWAVGNIGYRRTQFRLERDLYLSDDVKLSLQGALAQNIVPDLAGVSGVSRETGDWPMLQARTGLTFPGLGQDPWTIGCSGHIGETGFDFDSPPQDDARFRTWSVNADVDLPLTRRLGVHGEFFTGANLSNLLGGVVQGIGPVNRVPLRSTGGWGEIWFDWTPNVTSHVGVGVDDPNNNDMLRGRTYNRVVYTNVWVQLTDHLRTGFEVSDWRTSYQTKNPGKASVLDWTVMYSF